MGWLHTKPEAGLEKEPEHKTEMCYAQTDHVYNILCISNPWDFSD